MARQSRKLLLTIAGIAFVLVVLGAARLVTMLTSPDWRLLRVAFRNTYTAPAEYIQVVEHNFGGRVRRESFHVWQDQRVRKVVQITPVEMAGTTMYHGTEGNVAYAPGFPFVLRARLPGMVWGSRAPFVRLLLSHPRISVDYGSLAGTAARIFVLRDGRVVKARLWVDPKRDFILRQERYIASGRFFDVTENRNIVSSPPHLAAALHVSPPARTAEVSDPVRWRSELALFVLKKHAPFGYLVPGGVPFGARLRDAEPLETAGVRMIAFRYARGHRGFTLFEYRTGEKPISGIRGELAPVEHEEFHVYRTERNGLAVAVIGRINAKEARDLFASLRLAN